HPYPFFREGGLRHGYAGGGGGERRGRQVEENLRSAPGDAQLVRVLSGSGKRGMHQIQRLHLGRPIRGLERTAAEKLGGADQYRRRAPEGFREVQTEDLAAPPDMAANRRRGVRYVRRLRLRRMLHPQRGRRRLPDRYRETYQGEVPIRQRPGGMALPGLQGLNGQGGGGRGHFPMRNPRKNPGQPNTFPPILA